MNSEKNDGFHNPAAMGQCRKDPAGKFPGIDPAGMGHNPPHRIIRNLCILSDV
jgi:hypothetical protein